MDVLDDLVLDEWKDGGQLAQLSLGVHLPQSGADEVVVEAVERQILTTVRVRSDPDTHNQPVASTSGGTDLPRFQKWGRVHFSCQEMIVYVSARTRIPRHQGNRERIWG